MALARTGLGTLQLGLAVGYLATCSYALSFSELLSRFAPLGMVLFGFYELTSNDSLATRVVRLGSLLCVGAAAWYVYRRQPAKMMRSDVVLAVTKDTELTPSTTTSTMQSAATVVEDVHLAE